MKARTGTIVDEHGNVIDVDEVPPGARLRVPLRLMDGRVDLELLHKVRRALSDVGSGSDDAVVGVDVNVDSADAAYLAYQERSRKMSTAWKTPPPWQRTEPGSTRIVRRGEKIPWGGAPDSAADGAASDDRAARREAGRDDDCSDAAAAYSDYCDRIRDAWRQP
jgi:hypothetical protein